MVRAPASADATAALTTPSATGGTVPSTTSVGRAPESSAVAAVSEEISAAEPATSSTFPSAASIRGAVGGRESSIERYHRTRKRRRHRRSAVLLPLLRRRRGRLERSRKQLGSLAKSAARGGGPPTPSIPVPCVRWRSTTTTAAGCTMAVAAAAAAAATITSATTTTHGGMQPVLEHCCGPLIRGNYTGGVRGEKKGLSVWISLLTAGKNGGGCSMEGDGLRAEGEFLFLFGLCQERLENRVLETALVFCRSAHENHEGGEYDIMNHNAAQAELWSFRAVGFHS